VADTAYTLSDDDLRHVTESVGALWEELRGARIFITGGTGFFGQWLVETLAYASERLSLGASAVVLTRDPARALARAGRTRMPCGITYARGDVRRFEAPAGHFEWCIHGAIDASPVLNANAPEEMIGTIVDGSRRVLDFAAKQPLRGLLLLSSGAVYGRQPPELALVPEEYLGGPDVTDPAQAYAEGKRLAELMGAVHAQRGTVPVKIARCFAFVGPYLPLDAHFAIGNFIRSRLAGVPVELTGDGTPVRTYLYAADLAVWLWTILIRGTSGRAFNVGSEECTSIYELARLVSEAAPVPVDVVRSTPSVPGRLPERYAPSTRRARKELGLVQSVSLRDCIERTAQWYEMRPSTASS
jgi:nucleoside-diphosphate-sugar epimerase